MYETLNCEKLTELTRIIGSTLVSVTTGHRDTHIVDKWLSGDIRPTSDENRRIEFAHEQLTTVSRQASENVARNWFLGANVGKACLAPWEAIRTDDFDGIISSASKFVGAMS